MPSEYLTTSTNRPVVFSGGAFKTDSMTPWVRDLSIPEDAPFETSADISVGWNEDISGIRFSHEVAFRRPTESGNEYALRIVLRILCHFLVDRIPDNGLKETGETLLEIGQFYRERSKDDMPLLAEKTEINARRGRSYERPEFPIPEE